MTATCLSYYPSELETQQFWDRELNRDKAGVDIPYGFPKKLDSPLAWTGAEIENKQSQWKLDLTDEEIVAIDAALAGFEGQSAPRVPFVVCTYISLLNNKPAAKYDDLSSISASTFELSESFSARLKKFADQLYQGVGFQIVHGLDPSKYTPKQKIIVYAGVSAHICPQRGFVDVFAKSVTGKSNRSHQATRCDADCWYSPIAHVVNVQAQAGGPDTTAPAFGNIPLVRVNFTHPRVWTWTFRTDSLRTVEQSFHTDNCEIMAFFFFNITETGGRTILSSSWQTYNDLVATRPDVVRTLAEPWVMDTSVTSAVPYVPAVDLKFCTNTPSSFKPYSLQPPRHVRCLHRLDSEKVPVLFRWSRYPVVGWQRKRSPNLPEPTQAQFEAADAVQFTAMKNSITLPISKGDMLFVNDMALFHAREGFDDGGIPLKRHLVKMYMRDPDQGWAVPQSVGNEWSRVYSPNRPDGTRDETWNIVHEPGLEELSYLNG
jgi:hypothetical protein